MNLIWKPVDIAVVGSAHIDILADFKKGDTKITDRAGSVRFTIGGTAYNIAYNLSYHGNRVGIVTAGDKRSGLYKLIRRKLQQAGIPVLKRLDTSKGDESAFVAVRREGELIGAVSDCAIERLKTPAKTILSKIDKTKLIVIDCNVSPGLLSDLISQATDKGIPVFVSAVSEAKVHKLNSVKGTGVIKLAAMNKKEALALFGSKETDFSRIIDDISSRIETSPFENIVVTDGQHGYALVGMSKKPHHFKAPEINPVHSTHGAGDSLFSACMEYYLKNAQLADKDMEPYIYKYLACVLKDPSASPSGGGFYDAGSLVPAGGGGAMIKTMFWYAVGLATIVGAIAAVIALFR